MKMKQCAECGVFVGEDMRYCYECGHSFRGAEDDR